MWNYDPDEMLTAKPGDVVTLDDGQKVRVIKKTTTCISVEDYKWYHELMDNLWRRIGKRS